MLEQAKSAQAFRQAPSKKAQRGAGRHTLCETCNNNTGSWYVPSYIRWAEQVMEYVTRRPNGYTLALPYQIRPLRVLKQIVCMFASACGPTLTRNHPELTKFVLDRWAVHLPRDIKVFAFMMHPSSWMARQTGITSVLDASQGGALIQNFSELSFPPLGYFLTLGGSPPDRGTTDITFFADHALDQKREIHLPLPMRGIYSPFPGDFRSPSELQAAFDQNQGRRG
jgi:hypothetical protein